MTAQATYSLVTQRPARGHSWKRQCACPGSSGLGRPADAIQKQNPGSTLHRHVDSCADSPCKVDQSGVSSDEHIQQTAKINALDLAIDRQDIARDGFNCHAVAE